MLVVNMLMVKNKVYIMYSKLYGYENGKQMVQCNYLNNKKNGPYKEWHKNGQPYISCNYTNDKKKTNYQKWDENGKKVLT
jgi:antitoxin component YwqK of YwqJK toxin-antitoxin module